MAKTDKAAMPPVSRTSAGLRDAIFDELDALRNGDSNPTRANAVAKLSSSVVDTIRMELEVQRHARAMGDSPAATMSPLGQPLTLGALTSR